MAGGMHELGAVVAVIDPDANTAAATNTAEVDMKDFREVVFYVMAGDLGTSATLDFKVQESATSGGSFTDISGKSITQLTDAGSDSNKQVVLRVRQNELTDGQRFIRGVHTVGTATSDTAVIGVGFRASYNPATDDDLSTVDEIVS